MSWSVGERNSATRRPHSRACFREGSLQEKEGVSLGSEFSVLLPGIGTEDGAGLEWTLLASDRHQDFAWHLNLGPMLSRYGRGGMVMLLHYNSLDCSNHSTADLPKSLNA